MRGEYPWAESFGAALVWGRDVSAEPSVLRMPNRAQTGKHFSSRGLVFIFLGSVFSPSPSSFLSSSLGFSFCLRVGGSFIILTFLFYFRSLLFYHIPTVLLLDLSNFHLRHVLLCYLPMNLTLNLILHLLALPHPHPHPHFFLSLCLLLEKKTQPPGVEGNTDTAGELQLVERRRGGNFSGVLGKESAVLSLGKDGEKGGRHNPR